MTQTKPLHVLVYSAVENILEVFHYLEICARVSNSKGKTFIPHVLFQFFGHLNISSTAKQNALEKLTCIVEWALQLSSLSRALHVDIAHKTLVFCSPLIFLGSYRCCQSFYRENHCPL